MFKYKIEMFFINCFIGLLKILPEKLKDSTIDMFAMLIYRVVNPRRKTAMKNLKIAFPDMSEKKREKIAKASYKNVIRGFFSPFFIKDLITNENKLYIDPQSEKILDKAYAQGKGLILIGLHTGSVDNNSKLAQKFNLYDVVRKQKNPILDKKLNDLRLDIGLNTIYKGKSSVRELVKAIRNKGVVGLFSDHHDGNGLPIEFFNHKTKVSTGAINFILKYDVPFVFVFNVINEDKTSTIHTKNGFKVVKTGNPKKDMEENMKLMVHEFEKIITEYPEQWMWFHKRWRD